MPRASFLRLSGLLVAVLLMVSVTACARTAQDPPAAARTTQSKASPTAATAANATSSTTASPAKSAVAIFGGGCFWCMEPPFDVLPGVISTTSGYSGGRTVNPTYEQVSAGGTGHTEVVQVVYDPAKISYEKLLEVFWRNIDPVAVDRQFCDVGDQYRSAIYATSAEQLRLAQSSKQAWEKSGRLQRPIATEVIAAARFFPAETYHQDYYVKNPVRYKFYRYNCGRDQRLRDVWGEPTG